MSSIPCEEFTERAGQIRDALSVAKAHKEFHPHPDDPPSGGGEAWVLAVTSDAGERLSELTITAHPTHGAVVRRLQVDVTRDGYPLLLALPELLPTLMAESLVTYDVVPVIFDAAPAVPSVPHPASSLP